MVRNRNPAPPVPRHWLGREIAWALAFKTLALLVIYLAFFGPAHQVAVTADRMAAQLQGSR